MSNIDRMLIGKLDNNCDLLSSAKNNFRYVGEVKMSDRNLSFEERWEKFRQEKLIPCEAFVAKNYGFVDDLEEFVNLEKYDLKEKVLTLIERNQSIMESYEHLSSEYRNLNKSFADYQNENNELKKKVEELEQRDINRLFHKAMTEVVDLKKKLSEAVEVIAFYGNQENWYSHGKDSTIKRRIDLDDGEEFLNYEYGGRRARAFLKGNKDE